MASMASSGGGSGGWARAQGSSGIPLSEASRLVGTSGFPIGGGRLIYSPSGHVLMTITLPVLFSRIHTTVLGVDGESGIWLREDLRLPHAENRDRVALGERYRTWDAFGGSSPTLPSSSGQGKAVRSVYDEQGGAPGSRSGFLAPRLHAAPGA